MISGGLLVALVSSLAALFFAVRALRARRLPFERLAAMAVAWIIIIAGLAFVLARMG